jgi:uncharacterized protein YgbK (DUF1537 family)
VSLALGCIADDYTGASDLANTLARNGLRTVQTIGVPDVGLDLSGIDAVVIALKSRSIAADEAVALSRAADAWLRAQGAAHVMFKICSTFDSTDAGNIGPVMDALAADCGAAGVLVTPAFPETGRTVFRGYLFVKDLLLHESPMQDHPLNPMRDSSLVRVLARQSAAPVGLIEFATVAAGPAAIVARQAELVRDGYGAAIIDAVLDADLESIGQAAIGQKLSVGASGLGLGLARGLRPGREPTAPAFDSVAIGGFGACLVGSCSQASRQQVARAAQAMPVLQLATEKLLAGSGEIDAALAWAAPLLAAGPVLIASSDDADALALMHEKYGRAQSGHQIEQALAAIADGLVRLGVTRLAIGGGETSGAIVDRLCVKTLEVGPELAPGVPMLRTRGRAGGDMLLALKSGNFGAEDFFAHALQAMR